MERLPLSLRISTFIQRNQCCNIVNIKVETYIIGIDSNQIISTSNEIENVCRNWRDIDKINTHFSSVIGGMQG